MCLAYDLFFPPATTFVAHWSERSPFIGLFVNWCREEAAASVKKESYLTYRDWKVHWQGHIRWLFFDDCCWYSLAAVQRLQWGTADTGARFPVSLLGKYAANSLATPLCVSKNAVIKWKRHENMVCCSSTWKWTHMFIFALWHHVLGKRDFAITENKQWLSVYLQRKVNERKYSFWYNTVWLI